MKPTTWLGIAFVAVVLAFIAFSSFHQQRVTCRACVTFNGRQDCRTASAANRQEAERTAVSNACDCGLLAGGCVDGFMALDLAGARYVDLHGRCLAGGLWDLALRDGESASSHHSGQTYLVLNRSRKK